MTLGMAEYDNLKSENFSFKAEATFFFEGKPSPQKLYIGLPKWSDLEVVGRKTRSKEFLQIYSKLYNCVELKPTHYTIYDKEQMKRWRTAAQSTDFLFCPKMYNGITHIGSLLRKEGLVEKFLESVSYLKEHLGPIFIQLDETFERTRIKVDSFSEFIT
jgi:uncharacterized protein YecE (DUF72 family)